MSRCLYPISSSTYSSGTTLAGQIVMQELRPDLTLIDKTNDTVSFIDVTMPWDSRVEDKGGKKIEKYKTYKLNSESCGKYQ